MKWYELTLPDWFAGKTPHRHGRAAGVSAGADESLPDSGSQSGATDALRAAGSESDKRRNNYEHGDAGPPQNDAGRGVKGMATKKGL